MDYARRKKKIAKSLGISTIELDRMVAKERKERELATALYEHWSVDPCDEPIDGNALLNALIAVLRRYVIMSEHQAVVVALWIIFTWLHEEIATHSPLLLVMSPQPNSGKTTLLKIASFVVRRGVSSDFVGQSQHRSLEHDPCRVWSRYP